MPLLFLRAGAAVLVLFFSGEALAKKSSSSARGSVAKQLPPVSIALHSSQFYLVPGKLVRTSLGSGAIADVATFPPNQLLITGKRLGKTTVVLWTATRVLVLPLIVGFPTGAITHALKNAIPTGKNFRVESAGTSIVVSGDVYDAAHALHAMEIVQGFLPKKDGRASGEQTPVVNLLRVRGDQQVQLEVAFAEVSRSAVKEMGFNFMHRAVDGSYAGSLNNPNTSTGMAIGASNLGENASGPSATAPLASTFGLLFAMGDARRFPMAAALSVLAANGYARTLAEPTLVAANGKEAKFLAGGEFPIVIPQSLGNVQIQFKKFGIQLGFTPTVANDSIQLQMNSVVSELNFNNGLKLSNFTVPGLDTRQSSTTVRLRDGQSFAVAGLLSDKVRSQVDKVPMLGDIPILGALFRSTRYQREETELLVVVTARLVRPLDQRPLLPGETTQSDPSDLEIFLFGATESQSGGSPREEYGVPAGPVGFQRGP